MPDVQQKYFKDNFGNPPKVEKKEKQKKKKAKAKLSKAIKPTPGKAVRKRKTVCEIRYLYTVMN